MSIWTVKFWRDAGERIVSSAGQGFLTGAGLGKVTETGDITSVFTVFASWADFPLQEALLGAGLMAMYTTAKCLAAEPLGERESAALIARPKPPTKKAAAKATRKRKPKALPAPAPDTYTEAAQGSDGAGPSPARPGRHARPD